MDLWPYWRFGSNIGTYSVRSELEVYMGLAQGPTRLRAVLEELKEGMN